MSGDGTSGEAPDGPRTPLVLDGGRLYLQRYWHYEQQVADQIRRRVRSQATRGLVDQWEASAILDSVLGPAPADATDDQRGAIRRGLTSPVSIIAGGPGTGKSYTVAGLLAAARMAADQSGTRLQVGLAAPTAKAAQRLRDAVHSGTATLAASGALGDELAEYLAASDAVTLHRLLRVGGDGRFVHDRRDPLPHHLVVVDEASMVDLSMMAHLLEALRPDARLVLVGDPNQLVSIEAGTVLSDLVGPTEPEVEPGRRAVTPSVGGSASGWVCDPTRGALTSTDPTSSPLIGRVTVLRRMYRFKAGSPIAEIADAVRTGRADQVVDLLRADDDEVRWIDDPGGPETDELLEELIESGAGVVDAARRGDARAALAAANDTKVLTGVHRGPYGLRRFNEQIDLGVQRRTRGSDRPARWFVGRPVMVTANDPDTGVVNGDVGVVVEGPDGLLVVFDRDRAGEERAVAPYRLDQVETCWAVTIHRSQGSEFRHAVVSLPLADSPVLTRQLLYTAVTRGRERLTVVGTEDVVRIAVERPLDRASGLRDLLWPDRQG